MLSRGETRAVDILLPLMPALAVVAREEISTSGRVSLHTRGLAAYIVERAVAVSATLKANSGHPDDARVDLMNQDDWREVRKS